MKRLTWLMAILTIVTTSVCSAMQMQQPVEIGAVSLPPMGYYEVKGATAHEGVPFKNVKYLMSYPSLRMGNGSEIFDKGVACFGNGEDCIYVHYDARDGRATYLPNKSNSFALICCKRYITKNILVRIWIFKTNIFKFHITF